MMDISITDAMLLLENLRQEVEELNTFAEKSSSYTIKKELKEKAEYRMLMLSELEKQVKKTVVSLPAEIEKYKADVIAPPRS